MGALGLALFSALSWGTADFFGGLTTRRLGILLVGVVSQGAGLVLTGAFIVIGGSPMPDGRGLLFGVAAGLCATIGLGALYQGLAVGPMSVVAPITALEGVVPVTVGFVRGGRPPAASWGGAGGAPSRSRGSWSVSSVSYWHHGKPRPTRMRPCHASGASCTGSSRRSSSGCWSRS